MPSHWKPEWQRETEIIRTSPDPAEAEARLTAAREAGIPVPKEAALCVGRDGMFRQAILGLDFTVLVSAVDRLQVASLQERVGRLTLYFICTRPRIRAVGQLDHAARGMLNVWFERACADGSKERLEYQERPPASLRELRVEHGSRILTEIHAVQEEVFHVQSDAAFLARRPFVDQPWQPSAFDLEVHYIGRARGVAEQSCALDRLESHEKYQQVMEEVLLDEPPYREVWLVLGSGTYIHWITGHVETDFPSEEIRAGADRAHKMLTENDRIDLTEAMLINHFKPRLNTQHVKSISLSSSLAKKCRAANITGLQLGFETSALGNIALYTEHVPRRMFHESTICLDGRAPRRP